MFCLRLFQNIWKTNGFPEMGKSGRSVGMSCGIGLRVGSSGYLNFAFELCPNSLLKNSRFVSGHRFSDAVSAAKSLSASEAAERQPARK